MSWAFEHHTTWESVLSPVFLDRWQRWALEAPGAFVFLQPALGRAWIETYRPLQNIEPRFMVAKSESCLVFFPLVLWRRNWKNCRVRVLLPLGGGDFDYHDPLVVGKCSHSQLAAFWNELIRELRDRFGQEFDQLDLTGIHGRTDSEGWMVADSCPWCDLAPYSSIEDFLKTVSKSLRNDLTRQQRRLSKEGSLVYHVYENDDLEGISSGLEALLRFHRRRWPNAYKAPGFHANLVMHAAAAGSLHFSELRVRDKAVSWHLGFVSNGRFYYYLPAYNPDYRDFSPGKVHLLYCMEAAIESGMSCFDHLRGEENYKNGWTQNVSHIYSFSHRQSSLGSRVRLGLAGLREIW